MPSIIFVGGCDRSGTTLLAREISNIVQDSLLLPETYFLYDLIRRSQIYKFNSCVEFSQYLKFEYRFIQWCRAINPDFSFRDEIFVSLFDSYVSKGLWRSFFLQLVNTINNSNYKFLIDSTPSSVYLKSLTPSFDKDIFLGIYRPLVETCNSLILRSWGPSTAFDAIEYWLERTSFTSCNVSYLMNYVEFCKYPSLELANLSLFLAKNGCNVNLSNINSPLSPTKLPVFTRFQHRRLAHKINYKKPRYLTSLFWNLFASYLNIYPTPHLNTIFYLRNNVWLFRVLIHVINIMSKPICQLFSLSI